MITLILLYKGHHINVRISKLKSQFVKEYTFKHVILASDYQKRITLKANDIFPIAAFIEAYIEEYLPEDISMEEYLKEYSNSYTEATITLKQDSKRAKEILVDIKNKPEA